MAKLDAINSSLIEALKKVFSPKKYIVYPCDFFKTITVESVKRDSDINININISCVMNKVIADFTNVQMTESKPRNKLLYQAIDMIYSLDAITDVAISCELTDTLAEFCAGNNFVKAKSFDGYIRRKTN